MSFNRRTPISTILTFIRRQTYKDLYKTMSTEIAESKYQVVMLRHGESAWNKENKFCGWYDAHLTEKGEEEACNAAKAIEDACFTFDIAYTSMLTRAQKTLQIILKALDITDIPIIKTWRLNERHYGGLTGLNKIETAKKYGEEQVQIWRRSYDTPPPPMDSQHKYYKKIAKDPRYADGPSPEEFPIAESLELTIERTLPLWNKIIVPDIKCGRKIIIAAHGNSLRGLVKHLDGLSEEAIMRLNLPTGIPFVYSLNEQLEPVENGSLQFLGNPETVKKAMAEVAAQAKTK